MKTHQALAANARPVRERVEEDDHITVSLSDMEEVKPIALGKPVHRPLPPRPMANAMSARPIPARRPPPAKVPNAR